MALGDAADERERLMANGPSSIPSLQLQKSVVQIELAESRLRPSPASTAYQEEKTRDSTRDPSTLTLIVGEAHQHKNRHLHPP
jgi:hypothetical protein